MQPKTWVAHAPKCHSDPITMQYWGTCDPCLAGRMTGSVYMPDTFWETMLPRETVPLMGYDTVSQDNWPDSVCPSYMPRHVYDNK